MKYKTFYPQNCKSQNIIPDNCSNGARAVAVLLSLYTKCLAFARHTADA